MVKIETIWNHNDEGSKGAMATVGWYPRCRPSVTKAFYKLSIDIPYTVYQVEVFY